MKGSRRARPRLVLFPERMREAAFSVLVNSVGESLVFAMQLQMNLPGNVRLVAQPHDCILPGFDNNMLGRQFSRLEMIISLKIPEAERMRPGGKMNVSVVKEYRKELTMVSRIPYVRKMLPITVNRLISEQPITPAHALASKNKLTNSL